MTAGVATSAFYSSGQRRKRELDQAMPRILSANLQVFTSPLELLESRSSAGNGVTCGWKKLFSADKVFSHSPRTTWISAAISKR